MTDACEHPGFVSEVEVDRLTDDLLTVEEDPGAPMTAISASIRIRCAYCGLPMRFVGPPTGQLCDGPAVSLMRDELTIPLTFEGAPEGFGGRYGCRIWIRPPGDEMNWMASSSITFTVSDPEKAPKVGHGLSVPLDGGTDWFELGTVVSARLTDAGREDCVLRPGDGVEFPDPEDLYPGRG